MPEHAKTELVNFTSPYDNNTNPQILLEPYRSQLRTQYGWIWSNLLSCLWIYFFIPETFMRTLEEIKEMFEHHVPARKWNVKLFTMN